MPYEILKKALGKRLKSNRDIPVYKRFPDSPDTYTLPAGKPSPVVTSFANGWYGMKITPSETHYIKKADYINIVPENAEDNSTYLNQIGNSIFDFISNTANSIKKQSGYLEKGFQKATSDLGSGFFSFGEWIQKALFVGGALIILMIIYNITK